MDKKALILTTAGTILLAILLLGAGFLIGHNLNASKPLVLSDIGQLSNSADQLAQTVNTITVTGEALIDIKPDVALINLGIEACYPDAVTANDKVNTKLATLTAGLQKTGLEKSAIVPSSFTLYPEYAPYQPDILAGFCARNGVHVTTSNLDSVSHLIDQAVSSGANNVYGVTFTAKDVNAAIQKGIRQAYEDAASQAQTLAKSMNMTLYGVLSSSDTVSGDIYGNFVGYYGGGGAVAPQDDRMTIQVTVVYSIGK